jgi:hypothetical protein
LSNKFELIETYPYALQKTTIKLVYVFRVAHLIFFLKKILKQSIKMKKISFAICNILFFVLLSQSTNAQTRQADSLALLAFYNSSCNAGCLVPSWNPSQSMDDWSRVTMKNGRVSELVCFSDGLSGTMTDLNLTQLEVLNLYGNNLTGLIPNFSNLPNLETLELRNNDIYGSVPDFSNLPNLKKLDLGFNQLSGTIPDFSNLPNVEELNLYHNQLNNSVPNFSSLSNLKILELGYNRLADTIPDFNNLPNLQELFLTSNDLSGVIPNFSNLVNLRVLYLELNQLTGNIPNFNNLPILHQLTLSNNQLSGNIPTFSNLYTLRFFQVSNNRLSGVVPDLASLLSNPLSVVDIDGNQFTFEDLLPNFLSICNQVSSSWNFDYQDQDSIGAVIIANPSVNSNYVIDLIVDDAVSSNVYYWSKNGVVIDTTYGINEYTITNFNASDAGLYTVEVTNTVINASCSNLSIYGRPVTLNAPNSINQIQTHSLSVSPNPVKDILYIQVQNLDANYKVQVINLQGQIVENLSGNSNKNFLLPMEKYPAGLYLVRLKQGDKIWQEKVIKQ